jgi:putative methionine-R-sulfoxide reductase with GAF domain
VFTTADGLLQNRVSFFGGDSSGNVYMCSRNGLYKVSPDEKVKFYNTANGLKNDICAGVQTDRYNNVWIANDNFLLCFNPATEQFKIFDQSFGITASGFRNGNLYDKDGTLFWGCNDGITFFQPADLLSRQVPVSISITSLASNDSSFHFTKSETISLGYKQNDLLFTINPVSLSGTTAIIYEYFLEGVNTHWQQGSINRLVSYQNLAPGIYTMKVRSSLDGKNWVNGSNQVLISIAAPWWMQSWFIIFCCLIAIAIVYKTWKKKLVEIELKKEEAETERAIHYFAASMHQHVSVDEILWDITRNCISKLHFEDCVIYLVKPGENLLQQMAAWGPKTKNFNRIVNPIELPFGKGIVGTVAQTGKAEIIGDTMLDKRYVMDDAFRYSEIAVPIIGDGEVLGVIDSEHSRKHFFTAKHLSILTTIASLVGNKIISARAEEKRRNTALELLENQRRTAEVEMQALRAQMNPHFMFNSLNSINNFILKNDPDNASAYLTRFARLMRLILDNSRQDWITLENELNALRLYIEMESLRFNNAFDYDISIHYDVNPEKVLIPPLIIQPYVENAIWHGLLHRCEKGSMLSIGIEKKENNLQVCIRDNGVGREAARKLKSKFAAHKKSHGIQITDERLRIMNAVYEVDARAEIKDETTSEGIASGTCVILTMKYKSDDLPNY